MDTELTVAALGLVPVIMVLVSLSKTYVDSKWAPLVALALGLLGSYFLVPGLDIAHTVLQGILLALTSMGLYSGGKTTINAVV